MTGLSLYLFSALVLWTGVGAVYHPFLEYSGSSFFDGWTFTDDWDRNSSGRVIWVNKQNATSKNLAFINPAGHAILRVDNQSVVEADPILNPNPTRDTVRLVSDQTFGETNLIIIDAVHIPFGCSVWPAFFTFGENWPLGGEIDIVEGINMMGNTQYALHTGTGCTVKGDGMTGHLIDTNCTSAFGTNSGCTVGESKPNSFGAGFANAGGGVWALQLDTSGVFIWFWSRPDVPESIKSATSTSTIDTASWTDLPSAAYPSTTCDYASHFAPQQLVLSIDLCGGWANSSSLCPPPVPQACNDIVTSPPSAGYYDNAYWEISYIRTYSTNAAAKPASSSTSAGGTAGSTTSGGPSTLVTGSSHNAAAAHWQPRRSLLAALFLTALVSLLL